MHIVVTPLPLHAHTHPHTHPYLSCRTALRADPHCCPAARVARRTAPCLWSGSVSFRLCHSRLGQLRTRRCVAVVQSVKGTVRTGGQGDRGTGGHSMVKSFYNHVNQTLEITANGEASIFATSTSSGTQLNAPVCASSSAVGSQCSFLSFF